MSWKQAPFREAAFWSPSLEEQRTADGTIYLRVKGELPEYHTRITTPLIEGAAAHGERVFLADRVPGKDGWRTVTYAEMADRVRRVASWLITQNLSTERPLLILSGNDIEHATMALAAIHVGIPHASIAPNYSLMGGDYARLHEVIDGITPGMAFADDGASYLPAIEAVAPGLPLVSVTQVPGTIPFDDLLATDYNPAVEAAYERITPDTVAKFLFTSGSTGSPKPVTNTHRMVCAARAMTIETFKFLKTEPPVVLDWAPWNHTAGGNSVFYMVLFSGGTLYIDDGKPTPDGMKRTIRNLREVSPTWYFNVPVGWDALVPALREDKTLRESLFGRLKLLWYAGASLTQKTWDALEELAVQTSGTRVIIGTGLGATETAPSGLTCTMPQEQAGNVGLPVTGTKLKLVPLGDGRYDTRIKGPNVMPGYWRLPEVTAKVFDEEGYYKFGDALEPVDPENLSKGFRFGGRTAENFKLNTGTWVTTGNVRQALLERLGNEVLDVVITGADRTYLGALVFLKNPENAENAELRTDLQARLREHAAEAKGSSNRVRRLLLLSSNPDAAGQEVTDKGSINQRAVLRNRQDTVEALYSGSDQVIDIEEAKT